jgi:hypothetical protein
MSRHTGVTGLGQVTKSQPLECFLLRHQQARDPQGQDEMEAVKIYLLMALIGVIAAASHRKSRRPTPEQSST